MDPPAKTQSFEFNFISKPFDFRNGSPAIQPSFSLNPNLALNLSAGSSTNIPLSPSLESTTDTQTDSPLNFSLTNILHSSNLFPSRPPTITTSPTIPQSARPHSSTLPQPDPSNQIPVQATCSSAPPTLNFDAQSKTKKMRKLFSVEEDRLLTQIMYNQPFSTWIAVAAQIPGRSARQCRDRWANYLSPRNKNGPWSQTEDEILAEKYREYGPQWTTIAKFFDGRSENNVKNRWYTHLNHKFANRGQACNVNAMQTMRNLKTFNHNNISSSINQKAPPPKLKNCTTLADLDFKANNLTLISHVSSNTNQFEFPNESQNMNNEKNVQYHNVIIKPTKIIPITEKPTSFTTPPQSASMATNEATSSMCNPLLKHENFLKQGSSFIYQPQQTSAVQLDTTFSPNTAVFRPSTINRVNHTTPVSMHIQNTSKENESKHLLPPISTIDMELPQKPKPASAAPQVTSMQTKTRCFSAQPDTSYGKKPL